MKLTFVLGTRPEIVKLWPLIELAKANNNIFCRVVFTGQHRELAHPFLELFKIQPDVNFELMTSNQSLNGLCSQMCKSLGDEFRSNKSDWVIVQGDTTTAFVGALAAFQEGVRVAHIEAGLRTHNLEAPFPEEANRQMIARLAHLHFCPTTRNADCIAEERISRNKIFITGNTVVDALRMIKSRYLDTNDYAPIPIPRDKKLILLTSHRRENFGHGLTQICNAVKSIALSRKDVHFVYPVHFNPNVKNMVQHLLTNLPNVELIAPVDYLQCLSLLSKCALALTDSGGIQEEAASFNVPVLIMRESTERVESIEAGMASLVGTDTNTIIDKVITWLDDPPQSTELGNPYGDGYAAEKILNILSSQN